MKAVKKLLMEAANSIDEKYNTQRQRIYFSEYIEQYELALALDSLIELADETEEMFTYNFWSNLEQAAIIMELSQYQEIIRVKINDFFSGNAKNFKLRNPDIEAEIYYLTAAEGGRSAFVYSGYRGMFFYEGQYNSAAQEFIGKKMCKPGETIKALMAFAVPEVQLGRLYEGLKFIITEGSTVIGKGKILKVLRPDMIKL